MIGSIQGITMRHNLLAGVAALALVASAPALAQEPIQVGQTVEGELADGDAKSEDGRRHDAFAFRAEAGERVMATLESDAFDAVLQVGPAGEAFEVLAENDDGPDMGVNARLVFTAPAAGDYVLRAAALGEDELGAYTLTFEQGPAPAQARTIAVGDTVNGDLAADDPVGEGGAAADAYAFEGRAGQRVRITLTSEDFDTYLQLFDPNRASLDEDDDGAGNGTNSRLTATLPADGTYLIEARAFAEATGDYVLILTEMEPERAPEPLAFGATVQGEIADGDPRDDTDRGFDAYHITGAAGQRVQAIMRSGDFDTLLQIGPAEGDFSMAAEDDDGLAEGTDSRLNFTLPSDGDYVIRAAALGPEEDGLYSLELIDRGPQPTAGSLLVGATARGVLTDKDATADDDSFYDAYKVELRAEEKLVISMVSNEVDSFVVVGRGEEDGAFEVLGSDDDSLSDTHSRLEWTAPETATYEIRAGTFQAGQTGAYALIVEKQP